MNTITKLIKTGQRISYFIQANLNAHALKKNQCSFPPLVLHVELTNACNLRCIMCFQSENQNTMKRKRGFMEFGMFSEIIEKAKGFFTHIHMCNAGETLLHPQATDMIQYAIGQGMEVELTTNATLLTREIAVKLINSGLKGIDFSFDGVSKETFERIRVPANYESTLGNIEGFLKLKKELGRKRPFTCLGISLQEENQEEVKKFTESFRYLGVDYFYITKPHNWAGTVKVDIMEKDKEGWGERFLCLIPWLMLATTWDGKIIACCIDPEAEYILGDVRNDSFRDVWNNEKMRFMRSAMMDRESRDIDRVGGCNKCSRLTYRPEGGYTFERIRYEVGKFFY